MAFSSVPVSTFPFRRSVPVSTFVTQPSDADLTLRVYLASAPRVNFDRETGRELGGEDENDYEYDYDYEEEQEQDYN